MELITITKKEHPEYYNVYHAAKVCDRKLYKHSLKYMFSDGKRIVGTNSRSLHMSKTEYFKKGLYEVLICTKSEVVLHHETESTKDYPDIDKIIPVKLLLSAAETMNVYLDNNLKKRSSSYSKIIKHLSEKNGITFQFLDNIISDRWTVFNFGENQVVLFSDNEKLEDSVRSVLVMPIILEKD